MTKRLVLIGYRCVGKTSIGMQLSKELGWEYVSTDIQIEKETGKTIPEIVKEFGWAYFRKLERQQVARLQDKERIIVDCGGGVVEDEVNMSVLVSEALVVWVDAEKSDILQRLLRQKNRPLLSEEDQDQDIEVNYTRRRALYEKYSQCYINTSGQTLGSCVREILKTLGNL